MASTVVAISHVCGCFKMFYVQLVLLLFLSSFSLGVKKMSYDGYKLFLFNPTTQKQLDQLLDLNRKEVGVLDFWLATTKVTQPAEVMVPPTALEMVMQFVNATGIPYSIAIQDLGKLISKEAEEEVRTPEGLEFFANYNSYDEVIQFFRLLVSERPDVASIHEIGLSYEGRPLELLRVTTKSDLDKPALWIQAGTHARELIAPAAVSYIAYKLISYYGKCDTITELVSTFDWYLLPVLNPDGYNYTEIDRLWRKTRSYYPNEKKCFGVDANRNWDSKWNDASGSSPDPCSTKFAGPHPFSEPETLAVSQFILDNLSGRLELFVDFHSYSQRWLSPWGYTLDLPPNYKDQERLAKIGTAALEKLHGTKYSVGSTSNIMYIVTGGARDWVYDTVGATYSYVVELRDKGTYGFLLPRRLILPTAEEAWEAIKAMGQELQRLAY